MIQCSSETTALDKKLFFNPKVLIFILFLHKNIRCGYSMPMCRAVSVLVRGTMKSLKLRSTKARYSPHCSSSLCLKPCHASSTLGSPGRTSICR